MTVASGLALFGTLMVYSASAMHAHRESGGATQFTYFYKQFGFTVLGLIVMYAVSRFDYQRLNSTVAAWGFLVVTSVFLGAVFFFPEINGAQRWIRLGGFSFQPSEMAKIALPIFLAYLLTKNEDRVGELKATVLPCIAVLVFLCGLVAIEPDLGTALVLAAIFSAVYFAAGAKLLHVAAVGISMVVAASAMVFFAPWRVERLMAFVVPFKHAVDGGYLVVQFV